MQQYDQTKIKVLGIILNNINSKCTSKIQPFHQFANQNIVLALLHNFKYIKFIGTHNLLKIIQEILNHPNYIIDNNYNFFMESIMFFIAYLGLTIIDFECMHQLFNMSLIKGYSPNVIPKYSFDVQFGTPIENVLLNPKFTICQKIKILDLFVDNGLTLSSSQFDDVITPSILTKILCYDGKCTCVFSYANNNTYCNENCCNKMTICERYTLANHIINKYNFDVNYINNDIPIHTIQLPVLDDATYFVGFNDTIKYKNIISEISNLCDMKYASDALYYLIDKGLSFDILNNMIDGHSIFLRLGKKYTHNFDKCINTIFSYVSIANDIINQNFVPFYHDYENRIISFKEGMYITEPKNTLTSSYIFQKLISQKQEIKSGLKHFSNFESTVNETKYKYILFLLLCIMKYSKKPIKNVMRYKIIPYLFS